MQFLFDNIVASIVGATVLLMMVATHHRNQLASAEATSYYMLQQLHSSYTLASAADVEAELERIGHDLQPLDIVVVNTSAGARYGEPDYLLKGCGMGREATLYLTSRGVRVTGTLALGTAAGFLVGRHGRDEEMVWQLDPDKCVACGNCVKVCTVQCIELFLSKLNGTSWDRKAS